MPSPSCWIVVFTMMVLELKDSVCRIFVFVVDF